MKKYLINVIDAQAFVTVQERHRCYRIDYPGASCADGPDACAFPYYPTCDHYALALALFDDAGVGSSMRQEMAHDFALHFIPLKPCKPWSVTQPELLYFGAGWGAAVISDRSMDGGLPADPAMSEGGI